MTKKLKCIMLIDDNRHDNFFHERVIRKADAAERVVVRKNAAEALDYLRKIDAASPDYPELIFLDINMPGMNGWDFLEAFKEIEKEKHATVIVMLTTSSNPDDQLKAQKTNVVADFRSKPLTQDILEEIIGKLPAGDKN